MASGELKTNKMDRTNQTIPIYPLKIRQGEDISVLHSQQSSKMCTMCSAYLRGRQTRRRVELSVVLHRRKWAANSQRTHNNNKRSECELDTVQNKLYMQW